MRLHDNLPSMIIVSHKLLVATVSLLALFLVLFIVLIGGVWKIAQSTEEPIAQVVAGFVSPFLKDRHSDEED